MPMLASELTANKKRPCKVPVSFLCHVIALPIAGADVMLLAVDHVYIVCSAS